jgi:hypothetical protein
MKLLYMFSIFVLISIILFMSYNNTIIEGNRGGHHGGGGGGGHHGGIGHHGGGDDRGGRHWNNGGHNRYGYGAGSSSWFGNSVGIIYSYDDDYYNDALYYQPVDNLCYNRYGNVTHCPSIRPYF